MSDIEEYDVVNVSGEYERQHLVHLLNKGWELQGGVVYFETDEFIKQKLYFQAIIKRKQKEKEMKNIKDRDIKQYRVVIGHQGYIQFEMEVEQKLRMGWELYGDPFYSRKHDCPCQAVVKRCGNNEEDDK